MKRLVFLLLTMCSFTLSQAQWWADPYLTVEEKRVDDKTKDDAYLAPNSKLVGKKWFGNAYVYLIFNSNGTGERVQIKEDHYNNTSYYVIFTKPITWKRNKSIMNITWLEKQLIIKPDASAMSKFSPRVQDEIKRKYAQMQIEERNKYRNSTQELEITKLTNDFLFFSYNDTDNWGIKKSDTSNWMSKKKCDETYARSLNQDAYDELKKGNYDKAIANIDEAIKRQPKDPNYYDSKGEILYKKGDKEGAKAMWNKVISMDPKFGERGSELYKLLFPSN